MRTALKIIAVLVAGTVLGLRDGAMHVACGRGALAVEQLQPPGKRAMPAADFLRGRGQAPLLFT